MNTRFAVYCLLMMIAAALRRPVTFSCVKQYYSVHNMRTFGSLSSSVDDSATTGTPFVVVNTATRGIGLEYAKQSLETSNAMVLALARRVSPKLLELKNAFPERLTVIENYDLEQQESIEVAGKTINEIISRHSNGYISVLFNAAGILGDGKNTAGPERSISDIDRTWLEKTLNINMIGHVMLTKALSPLFKMKRPIEHKTKIVYVSARVGSIGDNKLGGWYSYRISKSALNMFVKTLSLELKRFNCCCIAIHPGTTSTDLSAPFTKNVSNDKLFSTAHSVGLMMKVIDGLRFPDDNGKFYAYDNKEIEW